MSAYKYDFVDPNYIKQGSSFSFGLTFESLDLTDAEVRGSIRSTYSSASTVAEFDSNIFYDNTTGKWRCIVSIPASETALIPVNAATDYRFKETKYCYDLEVELSDGTVICILQGRIDVMPEATR